MAFNENDNADDSVDDCYWSTGDDNVENSYTPLPTSEEQDEWLLNSHFNIGTENKQDDGDIGGREEKENDTDGELRNNNNNDNNNNSESSEKEQNVALNYKTCGYCQERVIKNGSNLYKKSYKCKGCQLQRYCSRRCQKKDWKLSHRYICER